MAATRRSRARRLLSGLVSILSAVGVTALFGAGVTLGLLGHLNLPAGRRAVAASLGNVLADLFEGQIKIGAFTKVSPDELSAEDITVRDAQGRIVLKVTKLTAQADVLDILARIARGDAKLTIVVNHVRVERAEADLVQTEDGLPTLAHAFTPRKKPASAASSGDERYVRVWLPEIEVGHAFARGQVSSDTPTIEAEISGAHGSVLATPKGAAIDVNRFALLARGLGGADAKGVATLHIRAPGAVWSSFDGYIGELQFGSVARWEKEALDVKLDLPRAEPAAARALLAQWPLLVSADARLHVKGRPPDLDVDVQANIGDASTLSATGNLNLASPPRLHLDVEGRKLDLRALWANAPATSIDVDTDLGIHSEANNVIVELGGSLQPTSFGNFDIPAIDFTGNAAGGTFSGDAKVHDRGLPLTLGFSVFPDGKFEVDAEAKRVNLAQVERLKPYVTASGSADMKVHAAFDHGRLDTSLALDVRSLNCEGVALQSGRLTAGAKGSLDKLDRLALDARLSGKKLSSGRFAFEDVSATARGPIRQPTIATSLKDATGPSVDARATVAFNQPVSVRELSLGISRDNVEIRGDVAQVDVARDHVVVRDFKLHGASGDLTGNGRLTPEALSVTAQGQNLDLSAFSRVLGLPRGVLEGRASLNVDVATSGKTQRGSLDLNVSKATISGLSGISGQLSAKLDGRKLSGASNGSVEALGGFAADWDAELGGPLTERASFEEAIGSGSLALNDVALAYVGQLLPSHNIDLGGQASGKLKFSRSQRDAVPDLQLEAQTQGLSVQVDHQPQPWSFSGIELGLSAAHDGQTGVTSLNLGALQGADRLVSTSSELSLDLKAALSEHEPLWEQLENRPLLTKIVVNRVELDNLPVALRVPGVSGAVRAEGTLRGSLSKPTISLAVRAMDLRLVAGERAEPIDVCGSAEYALSDGGFNVGAEVFLPAAFDISRAPCGGKRIANLSFRGQAPYDRQRGILAWTGNATAALEALPLEVIPPLAQARVTGTATGTLSLDRDAGASANLKLAGLRVDRLDVGDGSLGLRSNRDHAHASFAVERGKTNVKGEIDAGLSWSNELPGIDEAQPIEIALQATKLEASVLEPLLSDFVSELRGNVDGKVNARLAGVAEGEASRRVEQVGGTVKLSDGSFVLTGLGFRLHAVDFTANARRDGKTTLVEVPDLVANAGASAQVQNLKSSMSFRLDGFDIVAGTATVNLRGLPLVVDGVTRAVANASIDAQHPIQIKRYPEKMFVDVPFQMLDVRLPDESSRELIDLNENENVRLLQPVAQPKATRDEQALPWQFAIHLGQAAKVERGALLDLPITGDPNLVLASGLGVTGSISLERRGAVQMLGKIFQIEGGAVVFDTPDPADPRLDVRASWRSPDGDTLFMYVSGTISKPRVDFDRPRDAALTLLLGGQDGTTNIGISALDTLLADTPLAHVQLRGKDSDESGKGPTYTAAYRASDRVIVEGNYQSAGSNGTDAASNLGAAVDYRMTKRISVRAQLGTIGTGVDLVYQYHY